MRRLVLGVMLAMVAMLVLATPAAAGGWAVVTLDSLPQEVRAGQSVHLGFMVRQHGKTPNSDVTPYLIATRKALSSLSLFDQILGTGTAYAGELQKEDILRVKARQEGAVGHFVLDVTFPSDGSWAWEIVPEPFEGTKFEPLSVLPAAGLSNAPANTAVAEQPMTANPLIAPSTLQTAGVLLLIIAAGLLLVSRRAPISRWLAARSR